MRKNFLANHFRILTFWILSCFLYKSASMSTWEN